MPTPQLLRFDRSLANWTGSQLAASPERWIHDLTAGEIADIDALLARQGGREDDLTNLTRSEVEMPTLGPVFARIRHELLDGCGIALISGLPVERYTMREAATAYWAIGLHLGEAVSQNAKGHALGHVRDLGFDITKPSARRSDGGAAFLSFRQQRCRRAALASDGQVGWPLERRLFDGHLSRVA
jgi:hypothetical protein